MACVVLANTPAFAGGCRVPLSNISRRVRTIVAIPVNLVARVTRRLLALGRRASIRSVRVPVSRDARVDSRCPLSVLAVAGIWDAGRKLARRISSKGAPPGLAIPEKPEDIPSGVAVWPGVRDAACETCPVCANQRSIAPTLDLPNFQGELARPTPCAGCSHVQVGVNRLIPHVSNGPFRDDWSRANQGDGGRGAGVGVPSALSITATSGSARANASNNFLPRSICSGVVENSLRIFAIDFSGIPRKR